MSFDAIFVPDGLREAVSDQAWLQAMLDFERALAFAEARAGVIPAEAATAIAEACDAGLDDPNALVPAASAVGNPAEPLVRALRERLTGDAATYVHWGATSQDVMDTAAMLVSRRALVLIGGELDGAATACAELARAHRGTVMAGRTLLQQAVPTTFGAKAAGWVVSLVEARRRLAEIRGTRLAVELGGAAGTLSALGYRGLEVLRLLAEELDLAEPVVPWHTSRVRIAELGGALDVTAGVAAKIGLDVALLAQTEVGEVRPSVGGGSSTMPHKRNPVTSAVVLSAALRVPGLVSTMLAAMVQEHERGLGGWHAEWETLPEIVSLAAGALHQMAEIVPRLEIDAERMRANLELTHGLIYAEAVTMALAEKTGKSSAHQLVEAACSRAHKEKRPLRDVLGEEREIRGHLAGEALEGLFDPRRHLGAAEEFVDRVVAASRRRA